MLISGSCSRSASARSSQPRSVVECLWRKRDAAERFTTAVSLHSHTSHSREYLDFIPRVLRRVPPADRLRCWLEKRHSATPDKAVRYGSAFWRPPLLPRDAYGLEAGQVRDALGLRPFVSITDHDDIAACAELCTLGIEVPISTEWTIPYQGTVFHIGVHNLPVDQARGLEVEMARVTANPAPAAIAGMLGTLDSLPDVLLVLNHPLSNEERVERPVHVQLLREFLAGYRDRMHAIELNGLQPAADNRECIELAAEIGLPVISGGDRHCREPNANLNLTSAGSFAEFVDEVRRQRLSQVLFMPQYREPIPARYIEFIWHAVQTYPAFTGRERWIDRIFYERENGELVSLAQEWPRGEPKAVSGFVSVVEFLATPRMRGTLRWALGEQGEIGA
jgi:hypothetical protein